MKRIALYIFLCIFAISTVSAAALACPMQQPVKKTESKADTPCPMHQENAPQKQDSGHKGVCFCMHAMAASDTIYMPFGDIIEQHKDKALQPAADEFAESLAVPPLRRPPKTIS
ncbi:MAG: hypothetical protein OXT65_04925 [Alphaproteobacteria bacterium]|nr:hypothetical protein [Alphaproteobacteria bacterium]